MPYHHPNYKSHHIIQQTNQRQNQYEKLSEDPIILKRSSSVESYHFPNHRSHHHTVLQKIELGWSDPFTIRQFAQHFVTHIVLYHQPSASRTKNHEKALQARTKT
jgi:hypothetical protein